MKMGYNPTPANVTARLSRLVRSPEEPVAVFLPGRDVRRPGLNTHDGRR